jgi:adenylate cyclase class IV
MAEAFRTNIVLHDDEAKSFIDTMVVNTPEEMKITSEDFAEMQQIAKKLGFSPL